MELVELIQQIWLTKKHSQVFLLLYEHWSKSAWTLAKMIWDERTNVYKTLQVLVKEWLVAENIKNNVKHFFIPNKDILRNKIEQQKEIIENKEKLLPQIEQWLSELDKNRFSPIPKMRFFEWNDWVLSLFNDIFLEAKSKKYMAIKCITSNTLETLSLNNKNLENYTWDFFTKMEDNKIKVEAYLWSWILMLEQIIKSYDLVDIKKLSVWNNSLVFFIVWEIVYLIIFKQVPFWIKLESSEFADLMHFLLKIL